MLRLPSHYRLVLWIVMAILLIVLLVVPAPDYSQNQTPVTDPQALVSVDSRPASDEELQLDIKALGQRKLARRVYLLDPKQKFSGILAWWHDGEQERISYIAGPGETWSTAMLALWRALQYNEVYIVSHEHDNDLARRILDFPQPFDRLPEGWTLLTRK